MKNDAVARVNFYSKIFLIANVCLNTAVQHKLQNFLLQIAMHPSIFFKESVIT